MGNEDKMESNTHKANIPESDGIIKDFTLQQLVSMAKVNKPSYDRAIGAIKLKFSETLIKIKIKSIEFKSEFYVTEEDDAFFITDSESLLFLKEEYNFFDKYGRVMKRIFLIIESENVISTQTLLRAVNSHCTSLEELEIYIINGINIFDGLDKPFERTLKKLIISGSLNNLNHSEESALTFSRIFSSINCLEFRDITFTKPFNWTNQNLELLTDFRPGYIYAMNGINRDTFENIILKHNKTITILHLNMLCVTDGRDVIVFVAENLKKLEHLVLKGFIMGQVVPNKSIHFEHLKVLETTSPFVSGVTLPSDIRFDALEEFRIPYDYQSKSSVWMGVVNSSKKTLKRLYVNQLLRDGDIESLKRDKLVLEQFTVVCDCHLNTSNRKCSCEVTAAKIIEFCKSMKTLSEFNLLCERAAQNSPLVASLHGLQDWKCDVDNENFHHVRLHRKQTSA